MISYMYFSTTRDEAIRKRNKQGCRCNRIFDVFTRTLQGGLNKMSLEDKYIHINELEYKNEKIILPKIVYIKESYLDEQDKIGVMQAVFNELTNEPDMLFKLIKIMCETKTCASISIDTSRTSWLSDGCNLNTTVRNE